MVFCKIKQTSLLSLQNLRNPTFFGLPVGKAIASKLREVHKASNVNTWVRAAILNLVVPSLEGGTAEPASLLAVKISQIVLKHKLVISSCIQ